MSVDNERLDEMQRWMRQDRALEQLPWHMVKEVRNANGKLYPIDWERVQSKWKYGTLEIQSKEEFQEKLKELCDSLYDWGLYEGCPACGDGVKIPVWGFGGYTPFCGCSNYPKCTYSADRSGQPIYGSSPHSDCDGVK